MRLTELDLERERVLAALDRLKQSDGAKTDERVHRRNMF